MLEGSDLRVRRGGRRTLDGVDVRIIPGQVTAVVGPNGAGKSTLLQALTGRLGLETGAVSIDGDALADLSRPDIARRISVLQQHFQTTFAFRAYEIVAMGRAPHEGRETRDTAARIVEDAMAAAGVMDLADRRADQLSGGERQRIFLARALAQIMPLQAAAARYLLLDEPTASLDLRHQRSTLAFAREIAANGAGVLCVLHDLNLAARFADHAIVLLNGAVAAAGRPAAIFNERVISRVYGPDLSIFADPLSGAPVILPKCMQPATTSAPASRRSLWDLAAEAANAGMAQ